MATTTKISKQINWLLYTSDRSLPYIELTLDYKTDGSDRLILGIADQIASCLENNTTNVDVIGVSFSVTSTQVKAGTMAIFIEGMTGTDQLLEAENWLDGLGIIWTAANPTWKKAGTRTAQNYWGFKTSKTFTY